MDNFVNIDVSVDDAALQAKLQSLIDDEGVKTEVNQEFARLINPYVPMDTGKLSQDISVDANGVTYHAEYAAKNYYGDEIRHRTDKHPLATAHWDEVAMQTEMDTLTAKAREILVRKAKGQSG